LQSLQGGHTTVEQIATHFAGSGKPIGLTTIYRYLDRLVQQGVARRFSSDGQDGACYQLVCEQDGTTPQHFHLRCDACGRLIHLECSELTDIASHVYSEHAFAIDPLNTVFYGTCAQCGLKAGDA
jgi:Fur family ferric uptake transcriptional regulator